MNVRKVVGTICTCADVARKDLVSRLHAISLTLFSCFLFSCFCCSSMALLGFFYVFYTVPLTLASQFVDPAALSRIVPAATEISEEKGVEITLLLSGLITALIWSGFFALCPTIFTVRRSYSRLSFQIESGEG